MKEQEIFAMIKPDGMYRNLFNVVMEGILSLGLCIDMGCAVHPTKDLALQHYVNLVGEDYYEKNVDYICGKFHDGNPVYAMIITGEDVMRLRNLAGATNPEKAGPWTIRGRFGRINTSILGVEGETLMENVIHVSDSLESAEREIALWKPFMKL